MIPPEIWRIIYEYSGPSAYNALCRVDSSSRTCAKELDHIIVGNLMLFKKGLQKLYCLHSGDDTSSATIFYEYKIDNERYSCQVKCTTKSFHKFIVSTDNLRHFGHMSLQKYNIVTYEPKYKDYLLLKNRCLYSYGYDKLLIFVYPYTEYKFHDGKMTNTKISEMAILMKLSSVIIQDSNKGIVAVDTFGESHNFIDIESMLSTTARGKYHIYEDIILYNHLGAVFASSIKCKVYDIDE
jgi:hypothetical protein